MYRLLFIAMGCIASYYLLQGANTVAQVTPNGDLSYPGYQIERVEEWSPTARILSVKRYRSGREAELSPVDLALGWDQMADLTMLRDFDISQRNRWFYWRTDLRELPVSRSELIRSMSNVHIIPANSLVADQISDLKANQRVKLRGKLVNATGNDGWRWRSSLSRTDTGDGSCELLWLESIQLLPG